MESSAVSVVHPVRRCRRPRAVAAFLGALCWLSAATLAISEVIDVSVAGLYVGETKVVEAAVTASQRDGNVVRLQLGTPPHSLRISLVQGLLTDFPPAAEEFYRGKTVRAAGMIQSFRGELEMTLHSSADLQVVQPGAANSAGTAATGAKPPLAAVPPVVATLVPPPVVPSPEMAPPPTPTAPAIALPPTAVAPTIAAAVAPPTAALQPAADVERMQYLEQRVRELEAAASAATPAANVDLVKMQQLEERLQRLESTNAPAALPARGDDPKLRQFEERLEQLERAAQAPPPPPAASADGEKLRRIEERLKELEAAEARLRGAAVSNVEAGDHAGAGDDEDVEVRLRKLEIRLRHMEHGGQVEKPR